MSAVYIQVHFRLDFFMEANNMNPDQSNISSMTSMTQTHLPVKVLYSKTRVKQPLKNRQNRDLNDKW